MTERPVLSYLTVRPLLLAWQEGKRQASTSLDLGLSTCTVGLGPGGATLPDGQTLSWDVLYDIADSDLACFEVAEGDAVKIRAFSEEFNRSYSLMPTGGAPTMLISGVLMHRIKGIDPHGDTLRKVRTIAPLSGRVLDTCTGLGYTAIQAARTADQVVTIELDPTALEIARRNPWSRNLFGNPRIEQRLGDAFDVVPTLGDATFSRIIHDPPTFSLAGDLYSAVFYRQLYRVLAPKGRLFHYIGDLSSRSGRTVVRGVLRRLHEAGFSRVEPRPKVFGVIARKQRGRFTPSPQALT
jgi:predicted methyltransferase